MGCVYFVQVCDAVKIGYTNGDPSERMMELQIGCSYEMMLLGSIESPPAGEVLLHNALDIHRIRGEWFSVEGVGDCLDTLGIHVYRTFDLYACGPTRICF